MYPKKQSHSRNMHTSPMAAATAEAEAASAPPRPRASGAAAALAATPSTSSPRCPATEASCREAMSTTTSTSARTDSSTISKGAFAKQSGAPISGEGVTPARKSHAQ